MNVPLFRKQPTWRSVPVHQPKVISIPVHFVSSDHPPTAAAALKIQKLFRGYVVRKTVKKIVSIRTEVSEIERKIEDTEVVNLIRRDAKERLRVNETLMSLLFKLDSIRGADFGIRELRKSVTRRAIALQEKVDSIAQQTLECSTDEIGNEIGIDTTTEEGKLKEEDCKEGVMGAIETSQTATGSRTVAEFGKQREIGENVMDDNEKMMKLLMQICERNEMQTRMINMLSRRIEKLEKALITEKRRSKKNNKKKTLLRRRRDTDSLVSAACI